MTRLNSSPTKPSTSTPRAHDKSHAKNALTAATRGRLTLMCGNKWELVPPHALQATWFERTSGKQSGKYPSAHGTHLQGIEHMTLDQLNEIAIRVTNPSILIYAFTLNELENFANAVAENEREEIAKLFDREFWEYDYREIADAIRARKGER